MLVSQFFLKGMNNSSIKVTSSIVNKQLIVGKQTADCQTDLFRFLVERKYPPALLIEDVLLKMPT